MSTRRWNMEKIGESYSYEKDVYFFCKKVFDWFVWKETNVCIIVYTDIMYKCNK